jgi:pyruvate,water dikinase
MVRSDLASSGTLFTLDPESGFRNVVILNASYGLGESIVQGLVTPDEFCLFKPSLASGVHPILRKTLGSKETRRIYAGVRGGVQQVAVPEEERRRFSLCDEDAITLAQWACRVEAHYSAKHGKPTPMDLEWAKDGRTGELFLVQARPETVQSRKPAGRLRTLRLLETGPVLAVGRSVGNGIASGAARVVEQLDDMHAFRPGEVLVTDKTDPDWEPYLRQAAAVVTNRGSRTCHAAIVSRELGLPAVVGALGATDGIRTGQTVTVSCAAGERGLVYEGALPFEVEETALDSLPRPHTQVKLILADPDEAFRLSFLPNDGVGLARMEFIVGSFIRVHPMALVHPERLAPQVAAKVMDLARGYDRPEDYFVDQLSQGLALLAAAFHPKPVLLRFSDFKTNEYAHLIGGTVFEPPEENPMLGFRGASRYTHRNYREGFALECRAVKRVREAMGLANLQVMIPFCRTPAEGRKVLEEMAQHGLVRGEQGLEVHVMCEIPSNVLNATAFLDLFDGFSIGSNDLTQLTLGIDRDSELVAPLFDERDPAVKELMARAVLTCRARGRTVGICGQAPSDYPEVAEFLVQEGIHSLALNPDAILRTLPVIAQAEQHVFFPQVLDLSLS